MAELLGGTAWYYQAAAIDAVKFLRKRDLVDQERVAVSERYEKIKSVPSLLVARGKSIKKVSPRTNIPILTAIQLWGVWYPLSRSLLYSLIGQSNRDEPMIGMLAAGWIRRERKGRRMFYSIGMNRLGVQPEEVIERSPEFINAAGPVAMTDYQIAELIREIDRDSKVSAAQLADHCFCDSATAQRCIDALARIGVVRRAKSAMRIDRKVLRELGLTATSVRLAREKLQDEIEARKEERNARARV